LAVSCLSLEQAIAAPLVSGEPIPVGAANGVGPLASDKLNNLPVGIAHVYGRAQPDLFVIGGSRFYPELVLFPWIETSPDGVPVFGAPVNVEVPEFVGFGVKGTIFERENEIHMLWIVDDALVLLDFDRASLSFRESARIPLPKLPRRPRTVGVFPDTNGDGLTMYFDVNDGTGYGPPMDGFTSSRDPRYDPYDGAGVWRGKLSYAGLYSTRLEAFFVAPQAAPVLATPTDHEVLSAFESVTRVSLETSGQPGVIAGSHYGPLHYYRVNHETQPILDSHQYLVGEDGIMLRHPTIRATPVAYPNANSNPCDLLVGGEGAIYFYTFLNRFTDVGQPAYAAPVPALQQRTNLYAGTLPVPTVVDWDGDGAMDIISGNSEGFILFFRNDGDNAAPSFRPGVPLTGNDDVIYVQAGYAGSIQGPGEARWGYVCPTAADWNDDGLLDIVLSDVTAQHRVFLNEGTRTAPRLAAMRSIYLDGLELHGTWRVKPAVGKLAGRMAYAALDDDDEFHLYWQIDAYNVEDGGKLHLDTGEVIGANFLKAGGTGRLKLTFTDWDEDGKMDLLVGTPRHASIPDPEAGLPQALGLPGSAVILLRNTGAADQPVFAYPEILHFRGDPIYFGQHACGPTPAPLGTDTSPGLVVGVETGRLVFFDRTDINFARVDLPKPGE
jgi:hypothetical protein